MKYPLGTVKLMGEVGLLDVEADDVLLELLAHDAAEPQTWVRALPIEPVASCRETIRYYGSDGRLIFSHIRLFPY